MKKQLIVFISLIVLNASIIVESAHGNDFGVFKDTYVPIIVGDITVIIPLKADIRSSEVINITENTATVNWQTKHEATTELIYSINSDLSGAIQEPPAGDGTADLITHSIGLLGLQPGTTYYYKVQSRDSGGTFAATQIGDFTTKPVPQASENPNTTSYVMPDRGNSVTPYWVNYLRSYMDTTHSIEYCLQTSWSGSCDITSPREVHRRKRIVDSNGDTWKPFFGPLSGNKPGYYRTNVFGDVLTQYYTLWYLMTDELAIDYTYTSTASSSLGERFNFQKERIIWPGEVYDGGNGKVWAVVPMSKDILNTTWIGVVPQNKTFGTNGIGWKNYTVSIDDSVIAFDAVPPTRGIQLVDRTTFERVNGQLNIYISGTFSGPSVNQDLRDYLTSSASI